jgi:hypothetical protein
MKNALRFGTFLFILFDVFLRSALSSETTRNVYATFANVSHSIPILTVNELSSILDKIEPTGRVAIYVKIQTSHPIQGEALDLFLAPRPWWIRQFMVDDITDSWILLRREPISAQQYMKNIGARNYRSSSECAATPITFEYMSGDTWGNRGLLTISYSQRYPSWPYVVFSTRTGSRSDSLGWVAPDECSLIDKWSCLFLPQTNCTLPTTVVTSCLPVCGGSHNFERATADGKPTTVTPTGTQHHMKNLPGDSNRKVVNMYPKEAASIEPHNIVISETSAQPEIGGIFFMGLSVRFNTVFAKKVFEKVEAFRDSFSPAFHPSERCVTIHIRRGDRTRKGSSFLDTETITEFCKAHSQLNAEGKWEMDPDSQWVSGHNISYGQWMNMGCQMLIPYGAATLDHYLNASRLILPGVNSVFIMTDDEAALKEEIALHESRGAPTDLKMYPFAAGEKHRGANMDASAEWFASLMVAQQCEALVAYHSSAAAGFIKYSMAMGSTMRNDYYSLPHYFSMARHIGH